MNNRRSRLLAYSSASGLIALAAAAPAFAAPNACGVAVGGTVTCTPAGNPYPTGIQYLAAAPLTVNVQSGVVVNSPALNGVQIQATGTASGRINAAAGANITGPIGMFVDAIGSTGTATIDNAATIQGRSTGLAVQAGGNVLINNSGTVTIPLGTTSANNGLFTFSLNGNSTVTNSGAVTILNEGFSRGIIAQTTGAAAQNQVTNSGAITITRATSTSTALGIRVFSGGANSVATIVNTGPITISGASFGLGITSFVNGNTTTTSSGPITVTAGRATGIFAGTGSANGTITINSTGNVVANSTAAAGPGVNEAGGIYAIANNGAVSITSGTVRTTGPDTPGIIATTTGGAIGITSQIVSTAGARSIGIDAESTTGAITIRSGAVTTTGVDSSAIAALTTSGSIDIGSQNVSTAGARSIGIDAQTTTGAITIRSAAVATTGVDSSAIAARTTSGNIDIGSTGAITTTGDNSRGIFVNGGPSTTISHTGSISTSGNNAAGILALAPGNILITGRGSITTAGNGSSGLFARSFGGTVNVTTGAVSTSGMSISGVGGETNNGALNIDAQSVIVTGRGTTAIIARSNGGAITITSGIARAVDRSAIDAISVNGPVTVNINGATTSAEVTAVSVRAGTTAIVNVAAAGSVQGAVSGILVTAPTSITVTNAGSITGGTGFAIDAAGGPATVTNSGTITGALRLTGSDDIFFNSGTFNANGVSQFGAGNDTVNNSGVIFANADMDFGAGTDTFNNSGTLQVLLNRPAATTVTFTGLEAFNNSGLVDLRNARTGDVLNLPGTFTGSGNSRLGLDVDFGATTTADRLNIGGAATGSTTLDLAITGNPRLGIGPVLVQAGPGTSATAFVRPITQAGLVQLEVAFGNNAFTLVGTPSDAAFRTTTFVSAVRNLWHESADAWSAQMREGRDTAAGGHAGEPGARLWFQGYGRTTEREQDDNFTAFGRTRNVDLSYDQDFFGGQLGLDFGGAVGEQGGFAFGVTGGYADSRVNFEGIGDDLEMRAVNVGAYGRFSTGLFFINALAKYDHILDVRSRSQIANFDVDLDGDLYGASVEAGLRLGGNGFYIEPVASISYVNADLDGFTVTGTSLDFDGDNGLRGSAGARVGSMFSMGYGASGNIYAGAHYVHEFGGDDEVVLTSGGTSLRVAALEERDYVRGVIGLNVATAGSVSGFFEGNGEFLNDRSGYGLRAGMRIRF